MREQLAETCLVSIYCVRIDKKYNLFKINNNLTMISITLAKISILVVKIKTSCLQKVWFGFFLSNL